MKTEALIIGGGVPGLALATLLGQAGLETAVIDTEACIPLKDAAPSGRTSALMQSSIQVLKDTDVWERVAGHTDALKTLRIVDDSGVSMEPVQVDFQANEIGLDAFGYNTPNLLLRSALVERVSENKNITHIAPARLEDYRVERSHVQAQLDNGQTIQARIIIGADGRNSVTRACAGIKTTERDYDQRAITCLIDHSKPHDNISTEFHRPGGPFTLVPLPGKRSSVVWVEKEADAETFLALKKQNFEAALQDRTRGALGQITLSSTPESWPLKMLAAKTLTAERCALMAEAAHVLSPIGAQGMNLSLRDVADLADAILEAAKLGQDIGCCAVLERYEIQRKGDIASRVIGVDGLNRIVSNNIGLLRGLRRIGLKSLDSIPPLKEFAMQRGLV